MAMKGGFTRGRRALEMAEGLGTTLAVLALLVALLYAVTRPAVRVRIDLTEGATYELGEQTRQVLDALEEPITFISVMQPASDAVARATGLSDAQLGASRYVNALLHEYVLASGGQARLEVLRPDRHPEEIRALVDQLHLTRLNLVIVRGPSRSVLVFLEEMVTIDPGSEDLQAELVDLRAEAPLTSALLSVRAEVPPRVGFLIGKGGAQIDDFGDFGLGLYAEALRGQGLDVSTFDLFENAQVPAELDVVALVGPNQPLGSSAAGALIDFHDDGGALLVALDPEQPQAEDGSLDGLLARLGLVRSSGILTSDAGMGVGFARGLVPVRQFSPHEITAPIRRQRLFARFPLAGAVGRHPDAPADVVLEPLAISDPEVWADRPDEQQGFGDFEFDEDDGELRGARWLGVVREADAGGRAVVFGSARFLGNQYLGSAGGQANSDLGIHAVNWLADRSDAIAPRIRSVYESKVELYEEETHEVFVYTVLLLPLGGLALGLAVWFVRRR